MPYRRGGYQRTRRTVRRKRNRPNISQVKFPSVGGMSVPQMAKYGAVGYNILKGLINSELKRFDRAVTSTTITSTPQLVPLSDIAQGDDVGDRNGNKILGKYLNFDHVVTMDNTSAASYARIMIIVDTENTGSAPAAADILEDATSPNNIVSRLNKDNTQRFTVLHDKVHSFSNTGTQTMHRNIFKSLNFHINYTGAAGTTRNKNSIWLLHVSNEAAEYPIMVYSSRLAFYDN